MFGHKDYKAIEKKVPTAPYTHTYKAVLLLLLVKFLVQIYIYNFYRGIQYKSSQFTIFGAGELKIFGELIGNKIIKNHQYWSLQIQRNTVSIFFCFREKKTFWMGRQRSQ